MDQLLKYKLNDQSKGSLFWVHTQLREQTTFVVNCRERGCNGLNLSPLKKGKDIEIYVSNCLIRMKYEGIIY